MGVGFVFPGQGSQFVGMGRDLYEKYATVRAIWDEAEALLSLPIKTVCFEGPEAELKQTQLAQLGIFLVSASWVSILADQDLEPTVVAGHSLGELTAYYAAGVYDLETALAVIAYRGEAMAAAHPSEDSAMSAVMGIDESVLSSVIATIDNVVIANYNSPNQWVISGTKSAVSAGGEALKLAGAKRVVPLPVSGAFHSPLMAPAAKKFEQYLSDVPFNDAAFPIILNRTAESEFEAEALRQNLSKQVQSSVLWTHSVHSMADQVEAIYEVGPGKVLTSLVKKIAPELSVQNCMELISA